MHFKIYIYILVHLKITKSKKNQFFGNVDITNNMFEVLEMENRAVENRKEEIDIYLFKFFFLNNIFVET